MKEETYKFGDNVVISSGEGDNFGRYIGSFSMGELNVWHVVMFDKNFCNPTFFKYLCERKEDLNINKFLSDSLKFDIEWIARTNPTAKFFLTVSNIRHQHFGEHFDNKHSTLEELISNLKNEVK